MATGIVSVGMRDQGLTGLSVALLWVTVVCYAVLLVLVAWRLSSYPAKMHRDLADPLRSFGFFTFVAGTAVLGTRLAMDGHTAVAFALLIVAGLAWVLLGYAVPWTLLIQRGARPVLTGANGNWFIWVVAIQSLAVLSAGLEPTVLTGRRELALVAVVSWSVGLFLYCAVGVVVAVRLMLFPITPADLTPPYWVAMGATAISVLAGARIVEMATAPVVDATRGLVAGVTFVFWSFGTWLLPVLVAVGWWRHVYHRVPLRYEIPLWSIVFPLGMYGVASHYLGIADHLPIVRQIGDGETWIALGAWVITFVAMLISLARHPLSIMQ
jgi:tellurite resistance protein TehA-like permease